MGPVPTCPEGCDCGGSRDRAHGKAQRPGGCISHAKRRVGDLRFPAWVFRSQCRDRPKRARGLRSRLRAARRDRLVWCLVVGGHRFRPNGFVGGRRLGLFFGADQAKRDCPEKSARDRTRAEHHNMITSSVEAVGRLRGGRKPPAFSIGAASRRTHGASRKTQPGVLTSGLTGASRARALIRVEADLLIALAGTEALALLLAACRCGADAQRGH